MNETIYASSYLLGKDVYIDGKHRVENIQFADFMRETGHIDHPGPVNTLSVVWHDEEEDLFIDQVYDHETGEIYFEDEGRTGDDWTNEDETLINSIIMWADVRSTIS